MSTIISSFKVGIKRKKEILIHVLILKRSSSSDMELFDDMIDDGVLEPHRLSDDDLPSEVDDDDDNDDDDDDDNELNIKEISNVRLFASYFYYLK